MTRGEPDPVAEFIARLRAFREEAGEPSLTRLVELTEGTAWPLKRTTISDKLNGNSVVSWEFVSSFVTACVTHAQSAGRSLPPELTELGEWDQAHAEMLDAADADRTQELQAKAARLEKARRAARLSSPQPLWPASREGHDRPALGTATGGWEHARADRKPPGPQLDAKPGGYQPRRAVSLPSRTAFFTGREELLGQLGSLLRDRPVRVAALRGMGGIGKSQLALEYAHRHYAAGSYDIAWWVRAGQREALEEDLLKLAAPLGLQDASVDGVLAELGRRSNWLLIYDDVTDAALIGGRIPASGHVILTSRSRGWSRYGRPLDVGVFTVAESVSFLRERTGLSESDAALELASELGHLPLALGQAASYCEEHDLSIRGYLELFRSPRVRNRLLETGLHSDEYPDSVATTWLLHVDHLRKRYPAALQLLRLCSVLNPDLIRLDLFLWKYELLPEPLASAASSLDVQLAGIVEEVRGVPFEGLEEGIGELVKTGLVNRLDDRSVRIHRLVQAVTRQEMGEERAAAWRTYADLLVHALRPYPPFPVAPQHEWAFTHLRIHGAHLQQLLREGHAPEEPVPVNRFVALADFVAGTGDVETITDFEYAYECAWRLSLALHQSIQPVYCALALANLGYVRCLTGRHREAIEAMEEAASALIEPRYYELAMELSEAIRTCRTHSAPDPPAGCLVIIVEEHADLGEVAQIRTAEGEGGVPVYAPVIGQNEFTGDLALALGHDSDGYLPLAFRPLWRHSP